MPTLIFKIRIEDKHLHAFANRLSITGVDLSYSKTSKEFYENVMQEFFYHEGSRGFNPVDLRDHVEVELIP